MFFLTVLTALSVSWQAAQTPAPATTPRALQLDVRVTDRSGSVIDGARVTAEGPVSRDGTTDKAGALTLKSTPAGSYRLRIAKDGYITLEKEVTVKAGTAPPFDAALSLAPPPPAPPPPPPAPVAAAPAAPVLVAGPPRVLSIPDLAEKEMLGKETNKETAIGCSGATVTKLVQAKDTIAPHTNADADEALYLLAGDGTLKLAGKDTAVSAGWFALIPRGTEYSFTRKGRTPLALVSVLSGPPCAAK